MLAAAAAAEADAEAEAEAAAAASIELLMQEGKLPAISGTEGSTKSKLS